jgi:hypothetical protein
MAWKPAPAQAAALALLEAGHNPLPNTTPGPQGQFELGTPVQVRYWRMGRDGVNAICHREEPEGARMFRVHRDGRVDKL